MVPSGDAFDLLADDYRRMTEDGLLSIAPEPFNILMDRCADIARRVNTAFKAE